MKPRSLMNTSFDFVHNIGYDCVRITQSKQQFECRINNRPFTDLMEASKLITNSGLSDLSVTSNVKEPVVSKVVDPFAEFANIG
jgi:hypothetical protein